MAARGVVGRCKRRWKRTTIADPEATKAATDDKGLVYCCRTHDGLEG
jgi:hypothetical protein